MQNVSGSILFICSFFILTPNFIVNLIFFLFNFISYFITCTCLGFVGTPCITDCVMAELEKLGQKYRVALRLSFCPVKFI